MSKKLKEIMDDLGVSANNYMDLLIKVANELGNVEYLFCISGDSDLSKKAKEVFGNISKKALSEMTIGQSPYEVVGDKELAEFFRQMGEYVDKSVKKPKPMTLEEFAERNFLDLTFSEEIDGVKTEHEVILRDKYSWSRLAVGLGKSRFEARYILIKQLIRIGFVNVPKPRNHIASVPVPELV